MGVTFWGNFASGTLFSSISLAWHVLCASGSLCVREAAETAREFSTWPTRVRCSSIDKISAARVRRLRRN